MTIILAGLLAVLLLIAAWGDMRTREIPNGLNAAIALGAPLWWWATGLPVWPEAAIQIGVALLIFALAAGAFAAGMMGGGDVKMLAALSLWFAPLLVLRLIVAMSLIGGVLTLIVVAEHRWRKRGGQPEIPYGIAIAFAGLWVMSNEILTTASQ
jgi:prepilin peptidase CpaA